MRPGSFTVRPGGFTVKPGGFTVKPGGFTIKIFLRYTMVWLGMMGYTCLYYFHTFN